VTDRARPADEDDEAADRRTLGRARIVVSALVGGVLVLAAAGSAMPRADGLTALIVPAAVAGAASPVLGFRLYQLLRERLAPGLDRERRREAFLRANILAFAVTEGAAVFGVIVHVLTGSALALIGVFTHVLLAGALWPSEERLVSFVEPGGSPGT